MIVNLRISLFILLTPCCMPVASAQSDPVENPQRPVVPITKATCDEAPREDALVSLCMPPSFSEEDAAPPASEFRAKIPLNLPNGTPLRIALDQRTRVDHPGEMIHGKVVETIYAFDQPVVPSGSIVSELSALTPSLG